MLVLFGMTKVTRGRASEDAAKCTPDEAVIDREIKSHVEAIALYEDEASSSDVQLSTFAQRILPQLHRHLELLRSMKTGNQHDE